MSLVFVDEIFAYANEIDHFYGPYFCFSIIYNESAVKCFSFDTNESGTNIRCRINI